MSRRGNPYDNAQAESFMKTLKVEAVHATEYETFDDVAADCRRGLAKLHRQRLQCAPGSKTPLQAMKDCHKLKPKLFNKQPYYRPGCDS